MKISHAPATIAAEYDPSQAIPLQISVHETGSPNTFCQVFIYVVNRYGRIASNISKGLTVMIRNTISTPIVAMIGPIAFSTNEEKKKAIDAIVIIDHEARRYAVRNRHATSAAGKMRIPLSKTSKSPVPLPPFQKVLNQFASVPIRVTARPMLRAARKKTNSTVYTTVVMYFEKNTRVRDAGLISSRR